MIFYSFIGFSLFLLGLSFYLIFKSKAEISGFYLGLMDNNSEPTLLAITFSQVTSWIFSRSLLTAAILAYYYGFPGAVAYSTYYLSFLTGGFFILKVRKKYNIKSVVDYFYKKYGNTGKIIYSILVILRLISEIFANLIVVGLIFGNEGSNYYNYSIVLAMGIAFSYSCSGGFRNSIKTDLFQMIIFLFLLLVLIISFIFIPLDLNQLTINNKIINTSNPAYALIIVAMLQIWSYPIHDPVMMDRGFVCSIERTRKSFILAFILSTACIFSFSLIGVFLSGISLDNSSFLDAIVDHFGFYIATLIFLLLIISAISTLDSTLSSSAKLIVNDLGLFTKSILNGRLVMLIFSSLGLILILFNTKDIFTAVAVSGTAATFITPIFILGVIFGLNLSTQSLVLSFIASLSGSILYYLESQQIYTNFSTYFNLDHKYKTLLLINVIIIVFSFILSLTLKKKIKD